MSSSEEVSEGAELADKLAVEALANRNKLYRDRERERTIKRVQRDPLDSVSSSGNRYGIGTRTHD